MKSIFMLATSAGPGVEDNLLAGCVYSVSDEKAKSLAAGGYAEYRSVQPVEKAVIQPPEKAVVQPVEKAIVTPSEVASKPEKTTNASAKAPTWGTPK